ncbi:polysaccharide biosynthesis tyrosine autokinase [Geodermatophilus sp. DSM 45219]|uniref:polysaccharide biosynthesis tyrosine autokinase n=1 Tax=Geodermatophilus sp. DSM 45219 TaxID=1881103 RepID=UPI00088D5181|nr:polysaccharide biosynthesis tyrosine autokinase [Geodermatophilus sp. DSM 45219]SDN55231.1 receptor protein-tyrosine kinase [Geodermatophilus sp. DSM 45219]
MILHDYVRLLLHRWWVVAGCVFLGAGSAVALTLTATPTYYTQATVYAAIGGSVSPGDLQQGNAFTTQRVTTYAGLATTQTVLSRAAASLGDGTEVEDLRATISAAARDQTALIDITATGSDPVLLAEQANAVATALAAEAPLLDAPGSASPVQLTVVQPAEVPENALTPRPGNNVLVGTLVGLLAGVGILVVADALNTRVRSARDLPRSPAVATVTSIPGALQRFRRGPRSDQRLESFRNLRANLQFGGQTHGTLALAPVSATSDVSTVAHELGVVFAEIGSRIVLVHVDFRQPGQRSGQARTAETPAAPGVADVLDGAGSLDAVLRPVEGGPPELWEVPAGTTRPSSAQLLGTPAMTQFLADLTSRFDLVLVLSPPVVERSESAVVAALADSTLVVVEAGKTRRSEFLHALERLEGVRVTSVSVAIDGVHVADLGGRSTPPGDAAASA